ncbi:NAD(P)-binding protein [Guyanagaster necrorhizus]|uniref:NAD(P)-binding protein n=1 Tax=Guyanagaster necrorhizus TaxID=856835 RepID=A0A9P7VKN5_9AGAR|nr:NAD(P)-binding protein [Guyanagaster necrorhizus MCA 3950]XP_043039700.1 NAD(P)-binding protein [Guyanagaster necrorhizus MCA 3950]KAG7441659.1 NAD(P)-binding protein [Guyanagaster necrorhizus MCA 3950]KAG7446200.1 NAD(P)-binding protein [Guyanagaster necrorhizus MCA 3950]
MSVLESFQCQSTFAQGISAVIHVVSPFFRSVDDPEKDLLDPARQGTVKVLEACLKHGVRRVIVTGSIAAVVDPTKVDTGNPLTYEQAVSSALPGMAVYAVSKKIAEEAAFEFGREHPEIRITVMNPTMIYGPLVLPADLSALNTSSQDIYNLISGKLEETMSPVYADVRYVATLHVKALKVDENEASLFISLPSFYRMFMCFLDGSPKGIYRRIFSGKD